MRIILTNDDGIHAAGLRALYKALLRKGHEVHVVAPMSEQSGVGHSITIHGPLRIRAIEEEGFHGIGVHGTPSDCVKLGIKELLPAPPDIVVSGINAGANVGPDILYSGTVAAATEGAHLGFPALAVSFDSFTITAMDEHAAFAVQILDSIPWKHIPQRRVMNLNLPAISWPQMKGLKLCPQTTAIWNDWYQKNQDPHGTPYWWLDGKIPVESVHEGTDKFLLTQGYATLTPLRFDFTDTEMLESLANRGFNGLKPA